jgi:CubicO group peptidase (beta-lactamase class C family)
MWRVSVIAAALADRRAPDGRRNLRARARIKGRTSEASSAAMIRSAVLLLGCCLSLGVVAQARVAPATTGSTTQAVAPASDPARQALDAWLAAFNANDRKQLEAFRRRYQPTMDVDDMLEFFQRTGGFRLLRREPSAIGSAQALLQEHDSDTVARIKATVQAGKPLALDIDATQRPVDLRIPRLAQAAAIDALVAKADADAKRDAFSGVLLVARGDTVLLQRAWGLADRDARTPATMQTKFRLGSMDKMFTAVATLQLVQAGKLSLDGTVGQYLPAYPNAGIAKVTIRQLLTHAGGTGDIFGPQFDQQRLSLRTHDDYVRLYGARAPEFAPGSDYRYSNYGFVLLGDIIEHASGQSYYDYVDQHVFAPAGMHDTGFLPEDVDVPARAHAYTRHDSTAPWSDAAATLPYRGTAAGGGYSTAGDLLKFAQALRRGTLMPPALQAEMLRRQTPWYGYGFMVADEEGVPAYGHGGGAPGMNGELRIFPTLDEVVIALANVDPQPATRLVEYYQLRMPLQ